MTGQKTPLFRLHKTVSSWIVGAVALLGLVCGSPAFVAASDAPAPPAETTPPNAASPEAPATVGPSGYPLPRFVTLDSDRVHMRIGPGIRYPVIWVYHRFGLPLEIVQESDDWRKVRDHQGAEGWMHKAMLSSASRSAVVIGDSGRPLLRRPRPGAEAVAQAEPGVVVALKECPANGTHCRVEVDRFKGWLDRTALWGVYPGEVIE